MFQGITFDYSGTTVLITGGTSGIGLACARAYQQAGATVHVTGRKPELSTTGGTSDARFIKSMCPVVEFGLVGRTMHKVDEHVDVAHIRQLKSIYTRILKDYFK